MEIKLMGKLSKEFLSRFKQLDLRATGQLGDLVFIFALLENACVHAQDAVPMSSRPNSRWQSC